MVKYKHGKVSPVWLLNHLFNLFFPTILILTLYHYIQKTVYVYHVFFIWLAFIWTILCLSTAKRRNTPTHFNCEPTVHPYYLSTFPFSSWNLILELICQEPHEHKKYAKHQLLCFDNQIQYAVCTIYIMNFYIVFQDFCSVATVSLYELKLTISSSRPTY